ncbi:NAD(P)-dependent oxidoreductase [Clostridium ganghwense]|uniref:precorrin-2 dehydrogenase n=1 Tax=Clostridium ganghwense TaxID=312089 RepID=A0ABT4CT11_9CLOT|nr:NAD(P)-dependent oxidoreductase [Clostridium ganghwense]MCY6372187.1 NAD(P)-dependent oxidoreductase [Clostridium ganghwense]
MSKDTRENILSSELEYTCISLISNKTKVVIIGGGKASFIKCTSFVKRGCNVTVVSKEFSSNFDVFKKENLLNLKLIKDSYSIKYIIESHLVIIAVDDEESMERILTDCEDNYKLYLNCSNFKEGIFISPIQRETENIIFNVHTRGGSPKTSQFLAETMREKLKEYDGLVKYIVNLRERIKDVRHKNEILGFVSSEDFKFFYDKGVHEKVLRMFYGGRNFEFKDSD